MVKGSDSTLCPWSLGCSRRLFDTWLLNGVLVYRASLRKTPEGFAKSLVHTAVCKGVIPDASGLYVAEPPLLKIGSKALIIYSYIYNL